MKWLKTNLLIVGIGALLAVVAAACGSTATDEPRVLEELVRLEKAALDPYYVNSDPEEYVLQFAPERTYFDPWSAGRIDGDAVGQHLMSFDGLIPLSDYSIVNPAVAVRGDVAIFTFQVETYDPASRELTGSWNATEVREQIDDSWRMVHAHWSPMEAPGTDAGISPLTWWDVGVGPPWGEPPA